MLPDGALTDAAGGPAPDGAAPDGPAPDGAAPDGAGGPGDALEAADLAVADGPGEAADLTTVDLLPQRYTVGGRVSGLPAAASGLQLALDGGELLPIAADGAFVFATTLASGASYDVTIAQQPSATPAVTCTVSGGSGQVVSGDVTSILVNCAEDRYTLGGTISGLAGKGLVLANGADELPINTVGGFAFGQTLAAGDGYDVQVKKQPTGPSQTCTVTSGGTGTVGSADVTDVKVECVTNRYLLGGGVDGLAGAGLTLTLTVDGDAAHAVTAQPSGASYVFSTPVASGASYTVAVSAQPSNPTQVCTVARAAGTVGGSDVLDLDVTCATSSFTVGGKVSGLKGAGLALTLNGAGELRLAPGATSYQFPAQKSGSGYLVAVSAQPSGPAQHCTVARASGTVGGADVTDVDLSCTTDTFTVGGHVTGLEGAGLKLTINGGGELSVPAGATSYVFPALDDGASYTVAVSGQPSGPTQRCTLERGSGTLAGASVVDVDVKCTTSTFTVGGTVSGLAGSGLELSLGTSGQSQSVSVPQSGGFTFPTALASGTAYSVSVKTQPQGPSQTCSVTSGGAGTVGGADVTDVKIACTTDKFTVGGTVSGLAGSGLQLTLNDGAPLSISASGTSSFTFPDAQKIASGQSYVVKVSAQPSSPTQTCSVTSGGSGQVGAANVTDVKIDCTTNKYTVGGTVTGLAGSTGVTLQLNGSGDKTITASGTSSFVFDQAIESGKSWAVTVRTQPTSPWQTCKITGGSGTIGAANVTSVAVDCTTDTHTVGGSVTGLAGSTGVALKLTSGSASATRTITTSGTSSFTFTELPVASGQPWVVSVEAQPTSPWQTCTVAPAGGGDITSADVTSVAVTCSTNTYSVGGHINGLTTAGLELTIKNSDGSGASSQTVSSTGDGIGYSFANRSSGAGYVVSVSKQPAGLSCTVSNASGAITSGNVTNVDVTCGPAPYKVGGTVSGLAGSGLTLKLGSQSYAVSGNGSYQFPTALASGTSYSVTVSQQPTSPWQTCTVENASGTVGSSDVTNVNVQCETNKYSVRVSTTGLAGSGLKLSLNGSEQLAVPGSGAVSSTFTTQLASGASYTVKVETQPSAPSQTCTFTGSAAGTVGGGDVSLSLSCTTNSYKVGGGITGLNGTITLSTNGQMVSVTSGQASSYAFTLASGTAYNVTLSGPATQTCVFTTPANASGTVGGADVTNINVGCTDNKYSITVNLSGLEGSGLQLSLNGAAQTIGAGASSYTFDTQLTSGSSYTVSVGAQPTSPWQTCKLANGTTTASGTIAASNVQLSLTCTRSSFTLGASFSGLPSPSTAGEIDFVVPVTLNGSVVQYQVDNYGNQLFPISVSSGDSYSLPAMVTSFNGAVTVCTASSSTGTVGNANVTIAYTCAPAKFSVGGAVSGNVGGLSLTLTDTTTSTTYAAYALASGASSYAFPDKLPSGDGFSVTITSPSSFPSTNYQSCALAYGAGTIGTGDVTDLNLSCVTRPSPPSTVVAYPGNASAYVSFSGASGNGNTIASYTVTVYTADAARTKVKTQAFVGSAVTGGAITGLTNGTAYLFTVIANVSSSLRSVESVDSNSVTPAASITSGKYLKSVSYGYTGAAQTFTVPAGDTYVVVDLAGAAGGGDASGPAGKGGRVQGTLTGLTAGQVLNLYVGGQGQPMSGANQGGGGWNGGGGTSYIGTSVMPRYSGGGGASDIRTGTDPSTRLVVAGGGGGGPNYASSSGGVGGGTTGGAGGYTTASLNDPATRGGGGTPTAGGAAGCHNGSCGVAGALGQGGDAGNWGGQYGAPGGGGYYGGGGGVAGGGGGGGSSYTASGVTNPTHTQGYWPTVSLTYNNGNGYITLSYEVTTP